MPYPLGKICEINKIVDSSNLHPGLYIRGGKKILLP